MTASNNYYGFVGFLSPAYAFTLYDQNGSPLNLTGVDAATMAFELFDINARTTIRGSGTITIVNASQGLVSYQWTFQDYEAISIANYRAYATAKLPGEAGPRAFLVGTVLFATFPGGAPVAVQDVNLDQVNGQNVPTTVNGISVPNGTVPVVVVVPSRVNAQSGDFAAGAIADLATLLALAGTSGDANTVNSLMGRLTKLRDLLSASLAVNLDATNSTHLGNIDTATSDLVADLDTLITNTGRIPASPAQEGGNLATLIPGVQGWIAATGPGTAGQDNALAFAQQVRKIALYNASPNNVPLEFDQTAAATLMCMCSHRSHCQLTRPVVSM